MTYEDQVIKLAHQPLVLATLRIIAGAGAPVTPTALSTSLGKWGPNIARVLGYLRSTGLVEVERKGKTRLYQVPHSMSENIRSMIDQATLKQASPGPAETPRIYLTKTFYQNIVRNALETALPIGCLITTNARIQLNNAQLRLSTVISMADGSRIGIELNVGPPNDHFYSTMGKALTAFKDANLAMMIGVLLAPNSKDYNLPQLISSGSRGHASFGFICQDLPLKSEPAFGEETARKILNMIKDGTGRQ